MAKPPDLKSAYALETPADNKRLYADWANTYDKGFGEAMDYALPAHVADVFASRAPMPQTAVLDVGVGTGLLGDALGPLACPLDGLDISPDMLAVAAGKELYRDLYEADLTAPLDIPSNSYSAIISSGTFTHGHVGPDALDELLRIARAGAFFALSVNAEHFDRLGFASKFDALSARIEDYRVDTCHIYGANAGPGHKDDLGHVISFQKKP